VNDYQSSYCDIRSGRRCRRRAVVSVISQYYLPSAPATFQSLDCGPSRRLQQPIPIILSRILLSAERREQMTISSHDARLLLSRWTGAQTNRCPDGCVSFHCFSRQGVVVDGCSAALCFLKTGYPRPVLTDTLRLRGVDGAIRSFDLNFAIPTLGGDIWQGFIYSSLLYSGACLQPGARHTNHWLLLRVVTLMDTPRREAGTGQRHTHCQNCITCQNQRRLDVPFLSPDPNIYYIL
jgi:hypothetical protein